MTYQERGTPAFERPRFFHGQLLTMEDFELLSSYPREKFRLMHRYIHGTGIITGLWPVATRIDQDEKSLTIELSPGLAISSKGNEMVVTKRLMERFPGPFPQGEAFLYMSYRESLKNKVPGMKTPDQGGDDEDPALDESTCDYSRIVEGYRLELTDTAPERPKQRLEEESLKRHLADDPSASVLQRRMSLTDDLLDTLGDDHRVFLAVLRFQDNSVTVDQHKTIDLRAMHLSSSQREALLLHHVTDRTNPHGVTAAQAGALASLNGLAAQKDDPESVHLALDSPDQSIEIEAENRHIHLKTALGGDPKPVGVNPEPGSSHRAAREDHVHTLAPGSVNALHLDAAACFQSSDGSLDIRDEGGPVDLVVNQQTSSFRAISGWCTVEAGAFGFGESRWISHNLGKKAVAIQTALERYGDTGNRIQFGDMESFPQTRIVPGLTKAPKLGAELDIRNECFKVTVKNNDLKRRHFTVRWWVFDSDPVEAGDVTKKDWGGSGVDY